ncbi:glycosyltransferase family 2 protein [Polynucleobacter sp. MWH-UH35A]|nr:glycosyltransferase family 2 protein [Polynucleobacter sp. MWH-UH35A]
MMNAAAPVTVVIPCYRCLSTVSRAVESVMAQTMLPAEIILIDDCSMDGTLDLLYQLQARHQDRIQVVALDQNLGVSFARNMGWKYAKYPYIAFLDSDDAWHCRKIEIQYGYMRTHPDVELSGHEFRILLPQDGLPDWHLNAESDVISISKEGLLLSNPFITPSVMLRRDIVQRFIENRRHMEDHMLWLDIFFSGAKVLKLKVPLAATYKKSFGETGLSSQLLEMQMGDLDNYKNLLKMKYINYFQWMLLCVYSWCKFVRRLIISKAYLILRSTS